MAGIYTHREIDEVIARGVVTAAAPIEGDQVQPTSLDLRIGRRAHRIRAGFLPSCGTVEERLRELSLYEIDLESGAVLEPGRIHLVELLEELDLPPSLRARCNPKSSTGRLDVFTRVVSERSSRFDDIAPGYRGRLWLEVVPRSFPIRTATGDRLVQIRFLEGRPTLSDAELRETHRAHALLLDPGGEPLPEDEIRLDGGFFVGISLAPDEGTPEAPIGWKARRFTGVVDLRRVAGHDPSAYFEPIPACGRRVILEPEEFYIFRSRERIRVPPHLAAEMTAYHPSLGELRTHYAGFFDAGFGYGEGGRLRGTPAVLEVRPHDVPFVVEHGQSVFRLEFARTLSTCERLYGTPRAGSHYAAQGLTLAKQFRAPRAPPDRP